MRLLPQTLFMRNYLALFLLFAGLVCMGQSAPEPNGWEKIPAPKGAVADYEKLYTDKELLALTEMITKFELQTTLQIAIVTVNPELVAKDRFEEFTKYIGSQMSGKEKKKGVLIALSKGYHRIRIINSDGVKTLISDEETYRIVQGYFVPHFKENNYYAGTKAGLEGLMILLKEKM